MDSQLAFSTGLPRSGTNLLTKILSAHSEVTWACGPNIEIYREHRDAVALKLQIEMEPGTPFLDYFGNDEQQERLLRCMLGSSFDINVDPEVVTRLVRRSINRQDHDSPDLLASYHTLSGTNFAELVVSLAQIVEQKRPKASNRIVGLHESWTIESLPALAKSFPDARFIVMFRDVRATISSMLAFAAKNSYGSARPIDYVRHFRKQFAIAAWIQQQPELSNKIFFLRHEDLVSSPQDIVIRMSNFLQLDFEESMLDTKAFWDYGKNQLWLGNSAHKQSVHGFSNSRNTTWRRALPPDLIAAINLLAEYELCQLGYLNAYEGSQSIDDAVEALNAAVLLPDGLRWSGSQRTESQDIKLERMRSRALGMFTSSKSADSMESLLLLPEIFQENVNFRLDSEPLEKEH